MRSCFFAQRLYAKTMQGKPAIPDVFTMSNCAKAKLQNEERIELHDKLSLTGAKISVNRLPAGAGVPFAHSRKSNEEIYGFLEGAGKAVIDGEEIPLAAGDWLKIAPRRKAAVLRRSGLRHSLRLHSVQRAFPRRLYRRRRNRLLISKKSAGKSRASFYYRQKSNSRNQKVSKSSRFPTRFAVRWELSIASNYPDFESLPDSKSM